MDNSSTSKDVRRERFIRIVESRVNQILYNLDNLGKCSNKKNYQYSDADAKRVFRAIDKKVKEVEELFKTTSKPKNRFKLEV